MNGVVELDECEVENVVNMGDEKASSKISFQLAQDFYNEITGKSENISDYSREAFILKLHHVEQLHHKLEQSIEQYSVASFSESYSINYVDDCSERFSSLSKLKMQVSSRGAAIEDVSIQYNLLIILPKTNRPQEYKIHIKLVSRVAKLEQAREEMKSLPFDMPLFQFESHKIAVFSIDYVDVSVANALMSVIKGWFNSIEKNKISSFTKVSRKNSHFLPRICKYGLSSLAAYYLLISTKVFITNSADLNSAVVYLLTSFLCLFASYRIGKFLGKKAEYNLDSIYEQSYISFSGADENFVAESLTKIKNSRNKLILSIIATLALGAIASVIANYIIS